MEIGKKIKRIRTLLGLTQEELADRCELTKGYISQLENDLTEPSISTLEDILLSLGTNFKEFFNEAEEEQIIFTEDDYFIKEDDHAKITWLVFNSQKNEMEPIMIEIPHGSETVVDMPHEGQEFGYVLEGKIEVVLGNKKYLCKCGETFYFSTNKNHYLRNVNDGASKIIWVSSPPNF